MKASKVDKYTPIRALAKIIDFLLERRRKKNEC